GNDSDPDNGALTAVLVSGVSHGDLALNPDGSFTYRHDGVETAVDHFTYKANDSAPAAVSITILPVNDPPGSVGAAYTIDPGGFLGATAPGVLANDSDPENDPLEAILVTGASHGELTLNADGSFTYRHDGPDDSRDAPHDAFTYKANDGELDGAPAEIEISTRPEATTSPPDALHAGYPSAQTGAPDPTGFTCSTPYFSAINNHGKAADAVRIQLTAASDAAYTSPIWDSGDMAIVSAENGARLPDILFGRGAEAAHILQPGESYIWRIRTKSGAETSEWSANGAIHMASTGSFTAVMQPDPGNNDGADDGSMTRGKDVMLDSYHGGGNGNGGKAFQFVIGGNHFNSPGTPNGHYSALLRFNIDKLPEDIESASLKIYQYEVWEGYARTTLAIVKRITESWDEMAVTFNTRPAAADTEISTVINTTIEWKQWDVTSLYRAWRSGESPNYGLWVFPAVEIGNDFHRYYTSDHGDEPTLRPKLEVTYRVGGNQPPAIQVLQPDGVEDVADAVYTVAWTDEDPDDNAAISLFYDTDANGADGVLIAENIAEDDETDRYEWDVSEVPEGDYYIYAIINDGANDPVADYSEGTATIQRPSIPSLPPDALHVGYPSARTGASDPTDFTCSTPYFSAINNHGKAADAVR
ncbi:MAG: DNRLRE domain-containing protein, partial [Desulfobacterales bacterium]|nr:DNRLRE domain-containing protein [Desulfobacterales bacterium]